MFKNRVSAAFVLIKSQGISIILLLLLNYWAGSPDVRQRVIKLIKKKELISLIFSIIVTLLSITSRYTERC